MLPPDDLNKTAIALLALAMMVSVLAGAGLASLILYFTFG